LKAIELDPEDLAARQRLAQMYIVTVKQEKEGQSRAALAGKHSSMKVADFFFGSNILS
jgi:hypothetical protein